MLSRIRWKNSLYSQSEFCIQSVVCYLHFVLSLHFLPGLLSAVLNREIISLESFLLFPADLKINLKQSCKDYTANLLTVKVTTWHHIVLAMAIINHLPVDIWPSPSLSDFAFTMAAADTREAMEFSVGLRRDGEPREKVFKLITIQLTCFNYICILCTCCFQHFSSN